MTWAALLGLALLLLAAAAARCFRRGPRLKETAALALGALFAALMLAGWRHDRPSDCVIVLDQPAGPTLRGDLVRLLKRLRAAGVERVALVEVGPAAAGVPRWVALHADPGAAASDLIRAPARGAGLQAAMEVALDHLARRGSWEAAWAIVRGRSARLVVAASDPQVWRSALLPVDVDRLLAAGRRGEVVFDLVELTPHPMTAVVDVHLPLDIPAGKLLDEANVPVLVSVRAPALAGLRGRTVPVRVSGLLDGGAAALAEFRTDGAVSDAGVLHFPLPLAKFRDRANAARSVSFRTGFVLCELEVKADLDGGTLAAAGRVYLRVRAATVTVVCGPGSGTDRLRPPPQLPAGAAPPAAADEVTRLKAVAGALTGPRGGPLARFEFVSPAQFQAKIAPGGELPQLAVLHEVPAAFWTAETVDRLLDAARRGTHLMVVDPPALPATDPSLAKKLKALLPAFAQADERGAVPPPLQTVDRTPVLHLVFDYGRFGRFAQTPFADAAGGASGPSQGKGLTPALAVQKAAADALLAGLSDAAGKRLVLGKLQPTPDGELCYAPDPGDHVVVRVAPKLSALAQDALGDTLFPSAMELRVASLFEGVKTFGFHRPGTGLDGAPAPGPYPAEDPYYCPNQAVVLFTGRVPQPLPNAAAGKPQPEIGYRLGAGPTARKFTRNADGALANVLMRGVTLAAVQLTLPAYHQGLESLAVTTPGGLPNRFVRFTSTPEFVLQTQLPKDLADLAAAGKFLLTKEQAGARLLRGGAGPFFGAVDLTSAGSTADAKKVGKGLAERLLPLYRAPREAMAVAVATHDHFVDERIGPTLGPGELIALQADDAALALRWPADDSVAGPGGPRPVRWAAPRRFRVLRLNAATAGPDPDALPAAAARTLLYAVDLGPARPRVPPQPLAVGAVVENACVAVFAYSPFETAEPWWKLPDTIHEATAARADWFGPQRILDPAFLLTRLAPLPTDGPLVKEIRVLDFRGELEIVADFLPQQAAAQPFWRPVLVGTLDEARRSGPLDLAGVSYERGEVRFRLSPAAAGPLFPGDRPVAAVRLDFGAGLARSPSFVIRRSPPARWLALTAFQSAAAVAEFSGGVVGPIEAVRPHTRSLRLLWLFGLAAVLTGVTLARGWWRWRRLFPGRRALPSPEQVYPIYSLDVTALVERAGYVAGTPRSGRRNGILDQITRITGRDKLVGVRRDALARLGLGVPTDITVEQRVRPQVARLDVVVHLGASMRVPGPGGSLPKVALAAVCAQVLAELGWLYGAQVRLAALGLAGGLKEWGPAPGRDRENGLIEDITAWAKAEPPGPAAGLADLDPEPGTLVVFISDFLTEDVPALLTEAAAATEDEGRFAAVRVQTPEDAEQVGLGFVSPFAVLDRTGLTPADLRAALADRLAATRRSFAQHGRPLAAVEATMTGEEILAELEASEVLGRLC
jgi:hypothetical protein